MGMDTGTHTSTERATGVTPDGTLTRSQLDRRRRIIEATTVLAARGGYDAVQMRDVAEHAEVALGTLYRYFPSKVHLLVSTMREQTRDLADRVDKDPPTGGSPAERVMDVITRATRALQREPALTEAMTRALMFADASAAEEVEAVSAAATELIMRAMHGYDHEPTEDELARARVFEHVWWASILAWLSGRSSSRQMIADLEVATRLLLAPA